ncbi:hypothetical protein CLHOM_21630 [Clostridium homopropionicum DSM 5847]|uniref:Uncharacterized protein n=1 Tax=Clostridium homopropionicum DSM 5847 TaxID=1121318 RepID=A0A0L6Z8S0_9CLOT|nr:hypothetical protein [Clostridium homopropionicum]KOA19372.1 hypothetical protein CLHOM_21630 [Clostridium homopropionicum DSM 5847]SFG67765.1 hypothetical protein SAMN04488501_11311 [Clostridium homopropionicum]
MNIWNKRKNIIIVLISIIIIISIFLAGLFNKNGYKEYSTSESFGTLVDLLLKASSGDDTIKIDEEKINSIGASYFNQGIKKGNLTIKGLNVHIEEDKINLLIPVKYKFLPLVLSTEGKLQINEGNMVFYPEYFKAGSISVPKSKVFSFIKESFRNKIEIEENSLVLNKKLFSSKIEILQIIDGNLIAKVNDNTKKIIDKADKAIKAIDAKEKEELQVNSNKNTSSGEKNVSGSNNKSSSSSKELTSKESQIISIMNSTIATLDSNPSYNYWPNVNRVMGIYETLSPEEKASFISKVYNYVDVARAKRVKSKIK